MHQLNAQGWFWREGGTRWVSGHVSPQRGAAWPQFRLRCFLGPVPTISWAQSRGPWWVGSCCLLSGTVYSASLPACLPGLALPRIAPLKNQTLLGFQNRAEQVAEGRMDTSAFMTCLQQRDAMKQTWHQATALPLLASWG